jgi:hypothetical protein
MSEDWQRLPLQVMSKPIVLLPKYTTRGASSRLRTYNYQKFFCKNFSTVSCSPLFSDKYLDSLYSGKGRSFFFVLASYLKRFLFLLAQPSSSCIWIEKELFPYLPAFLEQFLLSRFKSIILDFDDAVFHNYDCHRYALVRFLLGDKHLKLCNLGPILLGGNHYICDYFKSSPAFVVYFPTVIDFDSTYFLHPAPVSLPFSSKSLPIVGWIGTPKTSQYLRPLLLLFNKLLDSDEMILVTVGADLGIKHPNYYSFAWSEKTEYYILRTFTVGIMPLPDLPFERGKCAYKILQYGACSVAVLASSVGANSSILSSERGVLASSWLEWESMLLNLLRNTSYTTELGHNLHDYVSSVFSLNSNIQVLSRILCED